MLRNSRIVLTLIFILTLTACLPPDLADPASAPIPVNAAAPAPTVVIQATPLPTRPPYKPAQLVDYIVQTGDTIPALAAHFNTSVKEIREANAFIPMDATTLPPGMPMKIPIYYQSLWGTPYQILPDSLFIYGPAQQNFDPVRFVDQQPGWLKSYTGYIGDRSRRGGEFIEYYSQQYSISPRLLLAILEYQLGALSSPVIPANIEDYPLNHKNPVQKGIANQLVWLSNTLNNTYYRWRNGTFKSFEHPDGRLEIPDPWQNAATVALQFYFSRYLTKEDYTKAVSPEGVARVYKTYFGDPWMNVSPHIPGSLRQPTLRLPFSRGTTWAFTGGPHTGWGEGEPFAALDFAPPNVAGGCTPTQEVSTAVAEGIIARTGTASAYLDLDGDGDERTGWVIFYLHLATDGLVKSGTIVKAGDPLGRPSCEGGRATGTHVHIARRYNGEWILADSVVPFDLEGWVARNGSAAYDGFLDKAGRTIIAGGDSRSHLQSLVD
ncbi:MAG TPA: LysM peptidoglycan-binding domain-containing M23 family metallopeptidase [Anaerolineaceae bacterium]